MKAAVIVLSDPRSGSEEALGRVFNALATVHDFKAKGHEVTISFQGAGSRWPGELIKSEHPFHALYGGVGDKIAGVSCGCADAFGAAADAEKHGLPLLKDNPIPGTTGLPSLASWAEQGYTILIF